MALKADFYKHTLNFTFEAGTSRGVLTKRDTYFLKLFDDRNPALFALGEAAPLVGLSPDFGAVAEAKLSEVCNAINKGDFHFDKTQFCSFPSILFALETVFNDFENRFRRLIFSNSFYNLSEPIPINGLVWMGTKEFMKKQILEKIESGYTTIKLKIGAIDFKDELELLKYIRAEFRNENIILRVDANGAFLPEKALEKLKWLSEFEIHSIEQPIKQGQEAEMAYLCEISPVPIALDEELILNSDRKSKLLTFIKPQYIILKPSLMGGVSGTKDWIKTAEEHGIGWWITSALESNVGLNAICQLTAEYNNPLTHGLGTGKLYSNNIASPLEISEGKIFYDKDKTWDLGLFS